MSSGKVEEKSREKSREKILRIIKDNPYATTADMVRETGLTVKGVEWNLKQLKKMGLLKRVGPDKGGRWEVVK